MKKSIILFSMLYSAFTFSQEGRLKYADKLYQNSAYYYAAEGYEDVLERGIDSFSVSNKIVECYDKINNVEKAVQWYDFIERKKELTKDQLLRSAIVRREIGDYEGSIERLNLYESKFGSTSLTQELITSNNNLNQLNQNKYGFGLKNENISTKASDFSLLKIVNNQVLLTTASKSFAVKQIHSWNGGDYYSIYSGIESENGQIKKLHKVKGELNTQFHDGPLCYDSINMRVIFTRDNYLNNKKGYDQDRLMRLKLYSAKLEGQKFIDVKELPFNSNEFSNGHPTISADGRTLYFVSDRPGGFGGTDIYKIDINEDGSFGSPINMGSKINTTFNEFTPFILSEESILFFSSEGHDGLGGYDVFAGKLDNDNNCISIENIGAPINSFSDDFSYSVNKNQSEGYLTSNRGGGEGSDDIYSFVQQKKITNSPVLFGVLSDRIRKKIVPNTTVYLYNSENVKVDSTITDSLGNYNFNLPNRNENYILTVNKTNYQPLETSQIVDTKNKLIERNLDLMPDLNYYLTGIVRDKDSKEVISDVNVLVRNIMTNEIVATLNTTEGNFKSGIVPEFNYGDSINLEVTCSKNGYVNSKINFDNILALEEEINMNSEISLELKKIVIGKTDLNDVVDINPIFFDYMKWDIRPDAAIELDKIVKVMKENPGMVIELGSHTDSRGSVQDNLKLSDKRAKSSASYIISKGIDKSRIRGKGYGESKLVVTDQVINDTYLWDDKEKLHQQNRRTEFLIVKMR